MKYFTTVIVVLLLISCSNKKAELKTHLLDSLRNEYAGKPIGITLSNNQAGSEPLTDQYAYTDDKGTDISFKLDPNGKYIMDISEREYIPTQATAGEERSDMILIESLNGSDYQKRGYVSYKYIYQFEFLKYYHFDK